MASVIGNMRRLQAAIGACALVGAVAALAVGATAAAPRARVALVACHPALARSARYLVARSFVRPFGGVARMGVRFSLRARPRRDGARLGGWHLSRRPTRRRPTPRLYRFTQRVEGLAAPATYRVAVNVRWYDRAGGIVRVARRVTGPCHQPDLRPDLRVRGVAVNAISATSSGYSVGVANRGRTAARPFEVAFGQSGRTTEVKLVGGGLAARSATVVRFRGAPCATAAPTIVVDPDNRVNEANEANNRLAVTCPAPAS